MKPARRADADPKWWKTQPFVPQRLTSARELRGIDVAEAERTSGLPIIAFERGEQTPTHEHVVYFAMALGFLPAFFTNPLHDVDTGALHFCEHVEQCDECFAAPSVAQCDYETESGTCDRFLCERHRNRSPGADDRDYCGAHANASKSVAKAQRTSRTHAKTHRSERIDPATTTQERAAIRAMLERLPRRG